TIERKEYIPTADILDEVRRKLENGDKPEYISFAGSGEPTLHSGLGDIIRGIKAMTDVPVVVFTNGSLLWMPEVRADLAAADVVIPSLDGGDAALLDKVNRPAASLDFDRIVEGLIAFRGAFNGQIWLEVMLLGGISDDDASVDAIARLAERIRPDKVQINSVCRPPAETYALPVPAARLLEIRKHFTGVPGTVEIIAEHLDDMAHTAFRTQIKEEDILALIERRPCTAAGAAAGLNIHVTEAIKHLEMLVADGKAVTQPKDGQVFYSACELRTE
ncbi:MAG: radical SAM protein, partial [Bilophila wadsworthia]